MGKFLAARLTLLDRGRETMSGRCSSEGSNAGKALISTSVYTVIFRVILSSDFHRKKKIITTERKLVLTQAQILLPYSAFL